MYIDDNVSPVPVMIFTIPIVAIVGGIIFSIGKTVMRPRVRELEIRERIAMIERGLVPPPEVDPRGFDRALGPQDAIHPRSLGSRHRRAGTILIGLGFGLMLLIGAGDLSR